MPHTYPPTYVSHTFGLPLALPHTCLHVIRLSAVQSTVNYLFRSQCIPIFPFHCVPLTMRALPSLTVRAPHSTCPSECVQCGWAAAILTPIEFLRRNVNLESLLTIPPHTLTSFWSPCSPSPSLSHVISELPLTSCMHPPPPSPSHVVHALPPSPSHVVHTLSPLLSLGVPGHQSSRCSS